MKRIYISPKIEIVECIPSAIIASSPLDVENENQWNDGEFDGEATGAARGDWDNIWQGM